MIDHKLLTLGGRLRRGQVSADARQMFLVGGREADAFYRQRFSHDRVGEYSYQEKAAPRGHPRGS